MEAVLAGVVAIMGTLLGSIVTHWLQRRTTDQMEIRSRDSKLREERIEAYGAFAAASTAYRQARITRWYRQQDDSEGPSYREARAESDRAQGAALHALFRAQIIAGDNDVTACAQSVLETIDEMRPTLSRPEFDVKVKQSNQLLTQFVAHASRDVVGLVKPHALRSLPELDTRPSHEG
ncbi:hypothetical protein AB0J35_49165 [Nonomuraea angiospora]|uniref:hypothetical protein n=1 Tax=Nonomuraea angiospora TaxID=46172 RepID=UPI00343CE637